MRTIPLKILVLGSSGYIGGNFSDYLTKLGYEVIEFDIKMGEEYDLRVKDNTLLLDAMEVADFIYFFAFDVGNSIYLENNDLSHNYISNNLQILNNTFNLLSRKYLPFIFISSQMASNNSISYGILKRLGEKWTSALGGVNGRIWNVFGGKNNQSHHVMQDFHEGARSGIIHLKTNGEEERQFIHIDDLNMMLVSLMQNFEAFKNTSHVDLTSHYWIKIKDLAQIFADLFNSTVTTTEKMAVSNLKYKPTNYFYKFHYDYTTLKTKIFKWAE